MSTPYVVIGSGQLRDDWPENYGASGTLAIFAFDNFVSDDGKSWIAGTGESLRDEFVTESAITVAAGIATYAAFSLPTTDTNTPNNIRYFGVIFDARGGRRDVLFENRHLRRSLGTSISMLQWANDNAQRLFRQTDTKPNTDQMNLAIAAALYAPATSTQLGLVRVSRTPVDTAIPIAVEDSDKRLAVTVVAGAQSGANAGAQIANAIAAIQALSANGGVVDARGLISNLTITSTLTIPDNITVLQGAYRLTCSAGIFINSTNATWRGIGRSSELFFQNAAGIPTGVLISGANYATVENCRITGSTVTPTLSRGLYISGSTNIWINRVWESGAIFPTPDANLIGGIGTTQSSNVWVTNCNISGNGFASGSDVYLNSYDLLNFAPTATGIHFRDNVISGSSTAFSIIMFDVANSDIMSNTVNQNNKLGTDHTSSGYGIAVYGAAGRCTNVNVSNNIVENTAGFGIYAASVDQFVASGNILKTVIQQQSGGSLALAGLTLNDVTYGSVSGGSIINSSQKGLWVSGGMGNSIVGVNIKSPAGDGIRLGGTPPPTGVTVQSCTIDSAGGSGIYTYGGTPITRLALNGNVIKSPVEYGILLSAGATTTTTISNNPISSPGLDGILILDAPNSSGIVITSNPITGIAANNKGIAPYGSNHIINDNTISASSATNTRGVSLDGPATDCVVGLNRITGFAVGIYGLGGVRNDLVNNKLNGNTLALNISVTTTHTGNHYSNGLLSGTAVLVAGTVTVNTAEVVASDTIILTKIVGGGTARGSLEVGVIVAATSFVINSLKADGTVETNDTSTVYYKFDH